MGHFCLVPDLNLPNFREMTITAQIEAMTELRNTIAAPITLIGSSMGGLLAALLAKDKIEQVDKLILLAPGFGIKGRWRELVGEEAMKAWQDSGFRQYYHFAADKNLDLHWGFIEDLHQYETEHLKVEIPTLVLHGMLDETVPINNSRAFREENKGLVDLIELNDGHELTNSLEHMWSASVKFLDLNPKKMVPETGTI